MSARLEDGSDRDEGLTVRFWGTRGSLPRPGPDTLIYGGNTTCVEVRLGSRRFIVDAGSGIDPAGRAMLDDGDLDFDILFSHLHHDHISGLPFFTPALKRPAVIRLHCGNLDGETAQAALRQMFSPPLFPVTLDQLPCRFEYLGFRAGETLTFENGIEVQTCPLVHPGGATAYRFSHRGRVACYVSDVEHVPDVIDPALVRFCAKADVVIYDTMYTDKEFQFCKGWGHSTLKAGVALCRAAGAKALVGTHHHTRHSDMVLEAIDAELQAMMPGSYMAREGHVIRLAPVEMTPAKRDIEKRQRERAI